MTQVPTYYKMSQHAFRSQKPLPVIKQTIDEVLSDLNIRVIYYNPYDWFCICSLWSEFEVRVMADENGYWIEPHFIVGCRDDFREMVRALKMRL